MTKRISLFFLVIYCLAPAVAGAQTLSDDPAFAVYRQAVQAAEARDYERATMLAKEAIARYPDHLLAWYLLGQAATARSAWDEAADAFANVVKRYPASFAAQRDLGLALEQLGRVGEARATFEAALGEQPDNQDVRLRLAFMLFDKGEPIFIGRGRGPEGRGAGRHTRPSSPSPPAAANSQTGFTRVSVTSTTTAAVIPAATQLVSCAPRATSQPVASTRPTVIGASPASTARRQGAPRKRSQTRATK
jgi:tetratricopeptide (TPR) repeat protein